MLVRSEPVQGAVADWFVTTETWAEIRAGLPEPGQAFAAVGEAENVSISCGVGESLAGFHRVRRWLGTRTGSFAPSPRRGPHAIGAAKGRNRPEVPPTNQGGNRPRKIETARLAARMVDCSSMVETGYVLAKRESRAAGRQSSTCGAAGTSTSTLVSLASWAC
jgi:hypothetical protein